MTVLLDPQLAGRERLERGSSTLPAELRMAM
jgi:hypothetical protein